MFIDQAQITVRGGKGGNGVASFRREKYVPRGGPDGGDGGRGGTVFLQADPQRTTLNEFRHRKRFAAQAGGSGAGQNCHGKAGDDLVIAVPCGTLVYEQGKLLADLDASCERICVARGGRGGLGNQHFATAIKQAPRFAQRGEPGEERVLDLQLKLLADAGIVGAPNAGKSTLLAAVSAARPKIADYPFTTLEPQLGVVPVDIDVNFVLVDVPGLIEGASKGAGLGDRFLKHIERTRVLIHLIDGAAEPDDAIKQLRMIEDELRAWDPKLLELRRIVAVSKQDLPSAHTTLAAVRRAAGPDIHGISAATGAGVRELMGDVYNAVQVARSQAAQQQAEVVLQPLPKPADASVLVHKEGRAFRLSGRTIERVAAMTDLDTDEGQVYLQKALTRSGARRKLERAGAKPGDRIRIGEAEIVL
ncbi:MAG: GTPase ObgE [Candidatus Eremiobacteraeota bacterium]|nr:GTPase ObgE [Candidatus Eremiobacteraeota bacterium]